MLGARAIGFDRPGDDAHPLRRTRLAVAHEHVVRAVRVARHEIRRSGPEPRHLAVTGDRRVPGRPVGLAAVPGDTRTFGRTSLAVAHEHVSHRVRVTRHQVRRDGVERDGITVGTDPGRVDRAQPVTLGAVGGDAHPLRRTRLAVTHEHVVRAVRVTRHEVAGTRHERHVAVVADRLVPGRAVGLAAAACDADPLRRPRLAVTHEHVRRAVRVTGHEIVRRRHERHVAAVTTRRRVPAETQRLRAVVGDAHPLRGTRLPVAREHVRLAVRVTRHEVVRRRHEHHVAAVTADLREAVGRAVGLRTVGGDICPLGGPRLPVVDKDVVDAVRVAGDQVCRRRHEHHVAAVRGDQGPRAGTVGLGAVARDAHPLRRALLPVEHEDVVGTVRVAGDEAGRGGPEGHETTAGADRRLVAARARLDHLVTHAHALDADRRARRWRPREQARAHDPDERQNRCPPRPHSTRHGQPPLSLLRSPRGNRSVHDREGRFVGG